MSFVAFLSIAKIKVTRLRAAAPHHCQKAGLWTRIRLDQKLFPGSGIICFGSRSSLEEKNQLRICFKWKDPDPENLELLKVAAGSGMNLTEFTHHCQTLSNIFAALTPPRRKFQLLCERMAALEQDSEMLVYRINQVPSNLPTEFFILFFLPAFCTSVFSVPKKFIVIRSNTI